LGCSLCHEDLDPAASHRAREDHEHSIHVPGATFGISLQKVIDCRVQNRLIPSEESNFSGTTERERGALLFRGFLFGHLDILPARPSISTQIVI
jgi:hypothetical protein